MNQDIQVYRNELNSIDNRITNIMIQNVDEETGELSESVLEELDKLELKKEELTTVLALTFHEFKAMINAIDNNPIKREAERLESLKKQYLKSTESLKTLIKKIVPEGEKITTDKYKIGWRKSTSYTIDDLTDLAELEKQYPQLVKVERKFMSSEAKNLHKDTGTLPEGVSEVNKNNIQIS